MSGKNTRKRHHDRVRAVVAGVYDKWNALSDSKEPVHLMLAFRHWRTRFPNREQSCAIHHFANTSHWFCSSSQDNADCSQHQVNDDDPTDSDLDVVYVPARFVGACDLKHVERAGEPLYGSLDPTTVDCHQWFERWTLGTLGLEFQWQVDAEQNKWSPVYAFFVDGVYRRHHADTTRIWSLHMKSSRFVSQEWVYPSTLTRPYQTIPELALDSWEATLAADAQLPWIPAFIHELIRHFPKPLIVLIVNCISLYPVSASRILHL